MQKRRYVRGKGTLLLTGMCTWARSASVTKKFLSLGIPAEGVYVNINIPTVKIKVIYHIVLV